MAELVTLTEFARRVNVSKQAVSKAIERGRIQKTASGKIDYDSQVIAWEQNRRLEKDHRSRGSSTGDNQSKDGTYQKLLAANKQMDYKLKELKLKEKQEELISKENLKKKYLPMLALIKNHIMSLPARHAYTLATLLIRHIERKSKNVKYIAGLLKKIDEQQLAREIGESLDSDCRKLMKEIANAEHA